MARILLKANPKCVYCLGKGIATPLHILCGSPVCRCVTEQLTILTFQKDYNIPQRDRYVPDHPEFVDSVTAESEESK
jgi:hypothetical protein